MVLTAAGTISMSDVRDEYKLSGPVSFNALRTADARVPQTAGTAITLGGLRNKYYLPRTGLQVFLDAKDSYPGTGTTWTDIIGGANATLINAPTYVSEPGYFLFNNSTSNQLATLPSVSGRTDFTLAQNYSVSVWFWVNNTQINQQNVDNSVLEKWINSTNPYPYMLRITRANNALGSAVYNGTNSLSTSVVTNRETWVHATVVFEPPSSRITIYYNGFATASNTVTLTGTTNNANSLYLMARGVTATTGMNHLSGRFSKLFIYSRALTATEVFDIYQSTRDRFTRYNVVPNATIYYDPALAATYPGSGDILTSIGTSNVNGTLTGGATVVKGQLVIGATPLTQYVAVPYTPAIVNNTQYTYELWFRDDAVGGFVDNTALISTYGVTGTTPYAGLHITAAGNARILERNTVGAIATNSNAVNLANSTWHHLVMAADATTLRLYVDGVADVTAARPGGTVTATTAGMVIGGSHVGRYQTCKIGPVRYYFGKALTAAEVQQNYNAERGRLSLLN